MKLLEKTDLEVLHVQSISFPNIQYKKKR